METSEINVFLTDIRHNSEERGTCSQDYCADSQMKTVSEEECYLREVGNRLFHV